MQSTRRVIRQALVEIIESKTATQGELLKACRLLSKITLAPKGKPRGRPFTKKVGTGAESQKTTSPASWNEFTPKGKPRNKPGPNPDALRLCVLRMVLTS